MNEQTVKTWMRENYEHLIDPITALINTTQLAEEAADNFNDYEDDNYSVADEYYDWAIDIEDEYKEENGIDWS